ncbi:site-specific DNA-methyltransferase [Porphyromonas miyakawae]|uniref:site-specific DNA-methyltransferase (adenine-specific) n=2 Tax=Porphyromonas miyakawae TaxID=3137470 RepID=A0ABQ0E1Y9_9PORP
MPESLHTASADGSALNLDALYRIAPSCFTEIEERVTDPATGEVRTELRRAVDFAALRSLLGNHVAEAGDERYAFTWPGKEAARREAATPVTDTLRPVPEESLNWEQTENLYIEGDNLTVLKLLQRGYMGKVKMIYIDPPYNTGNDFVYNDDFTADRHEYAIESGVQDELGFRYRKNSDSNGRFHSDWCSMIYPRLMVARTLLAEDGVIFISIDDNEVHNLRKICDEVFGAANFVAQFTRVTKKGGKSSESLAKNHDFVLLYAKQFEVANLVGVLHNDEGYSLKDEYFSERGFYKLNQTLDYDSLGYVPSLDYPITIDGETYYAGGDQELYFQRQHGQHGRADWGWRWSKELYTFGYENGFIVLKTGGQRPRIYTKTYQNVKIEKIGNTYKIVQINRTKPLSTLEFTENIYSNDNAKKGIDELMDRGVFEYTKPISLIKRMMNLIANKDALILDFFSGSATTAHAVMQLNAEDGGHRKYIMVQLPEETPEGSEARKAGYATIPAIAKERIRRAGKAILGKLSTESIKASAKFAKVALGDDVEKDVSLWEYIEDEETRTQAAKDLEEADNKIEALDTGFRVFRLDSTNHNDVYLHPSAYVQQDLHLFAENIKPDRTELDLLYGAMLAWGLSLSLPITEEKVDNCTIYTVDENGLVACFSPDVNEAVIRAMAACNPLRMLFRDSCFTEDTDKINLFEIVKQLLGWEQKEALRNIRVI